MSDLKRISSLFYKASIAAARIQAEVQRRQAAEFKAREMAAYNLSSEDFDRLVEMDAMQPGLYGIATSMIADEQFKKLKNFLAADTEHRRQKAAFLWRMRKVNAQSPEADFQEKIKWLRGLGEIEKIRELLEQRRAWQNR